MVKLWTVCYLLLSKWESWVSFKNHFKNTDSIRDAPLWHCPIPWHVTLKAPSGATGGKDPNVQHSNVFLVGPRVRKRWYKLRICNSFFGAYKATWGRLCPMMFNLDIQQGFLCSLLSSSDLKSWMRNEKLRGNRENYALRLQTNRRQIDKLKTPSFFITFYIEPSR